MKIREILEQDAFALIRKEVDNYADIILSKYITDIENGLNYTDEKEIFDVIWGPVEFNSGEIILLDSPLIQRLRKIKQLGLASYVYCGADYSRFAHTIGVFYLAGKMARMVHRHVQGVKTKYDFEQIVRLAALFHDAGHMYFSHVSERYFEENEGFIRYKEVKKALSIFNEKTNTKVSLHELIGVMLVQSGSVKKLLKVISVSLNGITIKSDEDLDEIVEYISCLIIGRANGKEILPYYQILNGPVDADKCDYLSRDSHATNVPVAVDIFRLIHKLSVEKGRVPENLKNSAIWEDDKGAEVYYPTIKASAIEALNQLVMARAIMYNSVYYHQKVRTAETMMRKIMESMNGLKISFVIDFTKILMMTDDIFGYYCFDVIKQQEDIDKSKEKQLRELTENLNLINFRFLMKRACSIDKNNWNKDGENEDKKGGYLFQKNIINLAKIDKIQELETGTKDEYNKICKLLNKKDANNREFYLMEFPRITISDSIPDAVISFGNKEVKKAADIFQSDTWIESKESRNKEQYLVTNCNNRGLAYLALQKVIFAKYGVILNQNAAMCSKVPFEEIKKYRTNLFEKGYYNDCLSLVSDLILSEFETEIEQLCKKFQTFEGREGIVINKQRIYGYLHQFMRIVLTPEKIKSLIDGVIRILQDAIYIDRKCFSKNMDGIFSKLLENSDYIYMCPLGGPKDSAFHLTYYLNDIDTSHIKTFESLQTALRASQDGDRLVFFDDGAYSGTQVVSIMEEYMGVPADKRSTDEQHVTELTMDEKENLMKRRISIAYICFNIQNEDLIREKVKELGISIDSVVYMENLQKKIFEFGHMFKDETQRKLVRTYLQEIGYEILDTVKKKDGKYKEKWSQDRVEKGALGYNDAQQSVILKSSVPTYTLTVFWLEGGVYKNEVWEPLFVRTNK